MQKQPFLVGGGSEKFEDWGGGGLKNFRTAGGGGALPHYINLDFLNRSFHPRGDSVNNSKQVEEWFDNVDGDQSVILLNHISYALRSMINKPQNCK